MHNEQFNGRVDQAAGAVKKTVGQLTDDQTTELEGAARQTAGKARAAYGDAVDSVRDYAERKPLGAIALGAGVGVLVGMLLMRRGND